MTNHESKNKKAGNILAHLDTSPKKQGDVLIDVLDVEVMFNLRGRKLKALRRASLELRSGETMTVVGESGSGKSVLSKTLIGMLDRNGEITGGSILYRGVDLTGVSDEQDWLEIRGKRIAMIFQDPMTALNPLKKIGEQIREVIVLHRGLDAKASKLAALDMLVKVGITDPERRYEQYPHEFSGGMRQRVVIATAIACNPEILICDEPTTALDVTIQAQILELIKKLQKDMGLSVLFITHDLGVVAKMADRIAVMYAGQVVEEGTVEDVFYDARHPYTWALLASLPQLGIKGKELFAIKGTPPSLFKEIQGDAFAPRNPFALQADFYYEPPMFEVSPTHRARTWYLDSRAPKVDLPEVVVRLREHLKQTTGR